MKKQLLLLGLIAFSLLTPVSQARAEEEEKSWPVFDVAKLASLVTNLVARYQVAPQTVERISQVNTMVENIKGVNQASVARDLKEMIQEVNKGVSQESYAFGSKAKDDITEAAAGANGAKDAAKKVKDVLFLSTDDGEPSEADRRRIVNVRKQYKKNLEYETVARSLYVAISGPMNMEEYFNKADKALREAETLQDSINANTMMVMVGNFGRINQISLSLADMRYKMFATISQLSLTGYMKPCPIKDLQMAKSVYNEQEKDEINVNFGSNGRCENVEED